MEENSRKLVKLLQCEINNEKTDVEPYLQKFTLNSICVYTQAAQEMYCLETLLSNNYGKVFWIPLSFLVLKIISILRRLFENDEFEKIPGPSGPFLINNSLDFMSGPEAAFYYFREQAKKYKGLFKLKIGSHKIVALYNPEDVETILSDVKHITKGYPYKFIKPWMVEGLALSKGSKWQFRRKLLTSAFYFKVLNIYKSIMEENSCKLVKLLQREINNEKTDVEPYLQEFTLNSICETAMGVKLDDETQDFAKAYKHGVFKLSEFAVHRTLRLWMHSDTIFSFTSMGREQRRILKMMNKFRDRVIDLKRETFEGCNVFNDDENSDDIEQMYLTGRKKLAMLDLLLEAEKQGSIDANGVKEEVDTFMFGGHDTSATALQYMLMLLANHPDAQELVLQEYHEVSGSLENFAGSFLLNDISKLKYLDCFIKECLRLYPSVPFIVRNIEHTVKLKDYVIPAGTQCCILIHDLHRLEDQFENPDEFQPERFMNAKPTWHTYAFIPFSAGPRNCIGHKYAMIQMKLAILDILKTYKLMPVTKPQDVRFTSDLMLRSTKPIYVKFELRNK